MRAALLILLVCIPVSGQTRQENPPQTGVCPKTAELGESPQQEFWFEGTLARKHVRMYLHRGGSGVVGVFYETTDWVPIFLGGEWLSDASQGVELTALNGRDAQVGALKGEISAAGLSGVWTPRNEPDGAAVHLKAVTQPKCDGNEPWKKFEDSHWPVSFSYPGSWHLSVQPDTITISCPDPSLFAYDGRDISVLQANDAQNASSDFVHCEKQWIFGYDCKCGRDSNGCNPASVLDRDAMTELKADPRESRVYCRDGGYVGLGAGARRIFTFGDNWIVLETEGPATRLIDRVAASVRTRK